jgi:hypothetical protein
MRVSMSFVALAAGSLLLMGAESASAQSAPWLERRFGAELMAASVDGASAEAAGTGSRMWGAGINVGLIAYRVLSVTAEGGLLFTSDEAQFTQETTAGERSSGVGAGIGTLKAGLRTPPLSLGGEKPLSVSAGVNVGRSWMNVTRTITECTDCHSETVDIGAGSFWEPGLHVFSGRSGVDARYRVFRDGSDLRNALMVGWSTRL